jgi:hypothetical protein
MQPPLTLTFRHVARSAALEAHARDLASRLQRIEDNISRCHMTLESLTGDGIPDSTYVVKIELTVPGAQIHADSLQADSSGHTSIFIAMRDAYNNARQQLGHLRHDRTRPP